MNIFENNDPRKEEFEQLCEEFKKYHSGIPEDIKALFKKDEHYKTIWMRYILDKDNNVVMVEPYVHDAWIIVVGHDRRIVKKTTVNDCEISTVFLTMNCNTSYNDRRILTFETMCFSKNKRTTIGRYETWKEALEAHNKTVKEMVAMA